MNTVDSSLANASQPKPSRQPTQPKQPTQFPDLGKFVERGTLDENLQQLAATTAAMLGADNCSIMLLEEIAGVPDLGTASEENANVLVEDPNSTDASESVPAPQPAAPLTRLVVCAAAGDLPAAAYRETPECGEGIAGHVLASGEALRLDDIGQSPFAAAARRPGDARRSLMCAPVRMHADLLGVINVSGRQAGGAFDAADLKLLEVIALFIGKSIQVSQLQSMLDSRFAQMALIREAPVGVGNSLAVGLPHPDQVAKIMAKSFYKEMTRAGFGSRQIINAASEIITQLSGNLQRHSKRLKRDGTD